MLAQQNKYTNVSGTFPNALMIDASGAGLTDGSEFAALPLNDGWEPFSQAVMSYASGVQLQNIPTGSVGVPNGVADSVGLSQMLEALLKLSGTGPGKGVIWWGDDDPSVTGDRVLLFSGQGILIAVYPELDDKIYVGDGNNAAVAAGGGAFYRSSDAGGATPNIAGPYLQLPDTRGYVLRGLDTAGAVDPGGAARFLGDVQNYAMVRHNHTWFSGDGSISSGGRYGDGGSDQTRIGNGSAVNPTAPSRLVGAVIADFATANTPVLNTDESRMTNISTKFGITY